MIINIVRNKIWWQCKQRVPGAWRCWWRQSAADLQILVPVEILVGVRLLAVLCDKVVLAGVQADPGLVESQECSVS